MAAAEDGHKFWKDSVLPYGLLKFHDYVMMPAYYFDICGFMFQRRFTNLISITHHKFHIDHSLLQRSWKGINVLG